MNRNIADSAYFHSQVMLVHLTKKKVVEFTDFFFWFFFLYSLTELFVPLDAVSSLCLASRDALIIAQEIAKFISYLIDFVFFSLMI